MKNFMKGAAITGGIFLLLGLMVFGIGVLGGGLKHEDINIMNEIGGLNISFDTGSIVFNSGLFENDETIYEEGEYTFEDMQGSMMEICVGAGQLKVEYHSEDTIKLEVGENDRMQCFMEDDTICIIGGCLDDDMSINSDMTLYLPQKFLEQEGFEKIVIDVAAGSFEMEGIVAKETTLDVGMGNVIVEDICVDFLEADIGMGNMEVTGEVNEKIIVDVGMGQLVLELYGNSEDYNYMLDCGMGALNVEDVYTIAGIGSKDIYNNAEKDLEASCGMGNIEVRFE